MTDSVHEIVGAMDRHWWYRGRAAAVNGLAHRACVPRGGQVLDYGCGTGHMGATLRRYGDVHGVDASPEALAAGHFEAYSAVSLVAADEPGALPEGPFSLIACLDVLEHVADDAALLRALAARLSPDGRLLVSVPLWPELFCAVDELAGHHRRYAPEALPELFASSGLRTVATSGYIVSLLPLARRQRRRVMSGKAAPVAELATPPAPVNAVLSLWAVAEGSLCRFWELPPGLSQLAALRLAPSGSR